MAWPPSPDSPAPPANIMDILSEIVAKGAEEEMRKTRLMVESEMVTMWSCSVAGDVGGSELPSSQRKGEN